MVGSVTFVIASFVIVAAVRKKEKLTAYSSFEDLAVVASSDGPVSAAEELGEANVGLPVANDDRSRVLCADHGGGVARLWTSDERNRRVYTHQHGRQAPARQGPKATEKKELDDDRTNTTRYKAQQ